LALRSASVCVFDSPLRVPFPLFFGDSAAAFGSGKKLLEERQQKLGKEKKRVFCSVLFFVSFFRCSSFFVCVVVPSLTFGHLSKKEGSFFCDERRKTIEAAHDDEKKKAYPPLASKGGSHICFPATRFPLTSPHSAELGVFQQ